MQVIHAGHFAPPGKGDRYDWAGESRESGVLYANGNRELLSDNAWGWVAWGWVAWGRGSCLPVSKVD
jgi:hypothetical protein